MIKQKEPELLDDQIRSLQWAIGELGKQRSSLEEKVGATRKREETEEIIEEVIAQREALDKRIGALQEGLEKSQDESANTNPTELQEEMSEVEGKLEVARERLKVLEQDKYLEELSRNLSGQDPLPSTTSLPDENLEQEESSDLARFPETDDEQAPESKPVQVKTNKPLSDIMTEPANRLSATESEPGVATTLATPPPVKPRAEVTSGGSIFCTEETSQGIREVAAALDLDPEYVLEKGMQAVLRMIARNGHRMTFPLDVKQVESLG
ncbi:MAG: hypothetical protein VB997_10370 [Opitutales bacterium]